MAPADGADMGRGAKDARSKKKRSTLKPAPVAVLPLVNDDDGRDPLQLSATENADLCAGCTRCCDTVSIEIDAPRSAWEYDQWVWVLHHRSLEIYVEKPERWFMHGSSRRGRGSGWSGSRRPAGR